jgi:CBS domain-containing protein
MIAEDIMCKAVITVREEMTLKELAKLLIEHHITGAPVVERHGKVIGVVSQTDLVRHDREQAEPQEAPVYHQELDRWLGRHGMSVEAPDYLRVRDVMTPLVLSADVDTPVLALARMMTKKKIHRLVITRAGKLAGIVTSMDIMRALVESAGRRSAKSAR